MDYTTLYTIYNDNVTNIKGVSIFLLGLFVMSGFMQVLVINTLIFGYLAYKTMEFLHTANPTENAQDTFTNMSILLKQWVVMSVLIVLEYLLGTFFGTLYVLLKIGSFVILLQNNTQLVTIYDVVLLSLFNKYQTQLDVFFNYLESKANSVKSRDMTPPKSYNFFSYIKQKFPFLENYLPTKKVKKLE